MSRKIVPGVVAVAFLLAACGSSSRSMHGTLTVTGPGSCGPHNGVHIVIRDAASKIVGTASIDGGQASLDGGVSECHYPFAVAGLPSGEFYTASVDGDYAYPPTLIKAADLSKGVEISWDIPR